MAQSMMKDAMTKDHQMRTSKVIGMTVYNDAGDKIGTVFDVLIRQDAEPTAAVDVTDFRGQKKIVTVPLSSISLDGARPMMKGATRPMPMGLPDGALNFGSG